VAEFKHIFEHFQTPLNSNLNKKEDGKADQNKDSVNDPFA
jgi:hypothetical protein